MSTIEKENERDIWKEGEGAGMVDHVASHP